ncbi:MAG: hypothetical protein NZ769_06955 [Anaerolineae bacterium]|nr:hypothetical protein [Anaerolineae bacterium]MCX8067915.1 hypothetical protein [Anaerolineae bacterium]
MGNPWVYTLAALGFFFLLAGLVALALPGPYEGVTLYTMDASHAVQAMDLVGLGLLLLGSAFALSAEVIWRRWMSR